MQASRGGQTGMFSPGDRSDVERVKDASDIVRIIGEHLALKPKGREFIGLCPFHDDKTPSLTVVPGKQIYKCFSCGAAGDVLTFVQKHLHMEFREALEYLAQRAGVELGRQRGGPESASGPAGPAGPAGPGKRDLHAACRAACDFFQETLRHPIVGKPGQNVIASRGISPEMVEKFQLGLAPDAWDRLSMRCKRAGIGEEVLLAAGLIKRRENGGGHYDAFRNRLIFPIADKTGRVIAFGARKINPEDEPKYLNSPETPLFHKSSTLYALHLAARGMQETRTAIVCEGYTDVIACHQAGFRNAVATLGTALTAQHARQLRLMCDKVVLLFDGDEAGQRAADRAISVFFREPIDVHVATLSAHTDAKDPDELLGRDGGREVFARVLSEAPDVLTYRFAKVRASLAGTGMSGRERVLRDEIQKLVELGLGQGHPIREALIIRRLTEVSGLSEATIRAAVPVGRADARAGLGDQARADAPGVVAGLARRRLTIRETLLGCLLCDGTLWAALSESDKDYLAPHHFTEPFAAVARTVHHAGESGEACDLSAVLSGGVEETTREAAIHLMSRTHGQCEGKSEAIANLFASCVREARVEQAHGGGGDALEPKPTGTLERIERTRSIITRFHVSPTRRTLPRPR